MEWGGGSLKCFSCVHLDLEPPLDCVHLDLEPPLDDLTAVLSAHLCRREGVYLPLSISWIICLSARRAFSVELSDERLVAVPVNKIQTFSVELSDERLVAVPVNKIQMFSVELSDERLVAVPVNKIQTSVFCRTQWWTTYSFVRNIHSDKYSKVLFIFILKKLNVVIF